MRQSSEEPIYLLLEYTFWRQKLQTSNVELGFEPIWLTQAIKILNKGASLSPALFFLSSEHPVWNPKYSEVSWSTLPRKFTADEIYHAASSHKIISYVTYPQP